MCISQGQFHWHCTDFPMSSVLYTANIKFKAIIQCNRCCNFSRIQCLGYNLHIPHEVGGIEQEPMSMWKLNISQWAASSGLGKHEAAGQVLSMSWWCNMLRTVWLHMRMDSCLYPMTCKKHIRSHVEIVHFWTPLFCTNYVLVVG